MSEPVWQITESSQAPRPGFPTLTPHQEKQVVFLLCVSVCKAGCCAAGVRLNR